MSETILLDLRDERGRFFTKVRLPVETYAVLESYGKAAGLTFEEVLHRAIQEYVGRTPERTSTSGGRTHVLAGEAHTYTR